MCQETKKTLVEDTNISLQHAKKYITVNYNKTLKAWSPIDSKTRTQQHIKPLEASNSYLTAKTRNFISKLWCFQERETTVPRSTWAKRAQELLKPAIFLGSVESVCCSTKNNCKHSHFISLKHSLIINGMPTDTLFLFLKLQWTFKRVVTQIGSFLPRCFYILKLLHKVLSLSVYIPLNWWT